MIIAKQKREQNIAEYLLYMWQVEDLLRANNLDIDKIQEIIIDKFQVPEETKKEMRTWYEELIDMMRSEGVVQSGHLQINKNVISELSDLHNELICSCKCGNYERTYVQLTPILNEFRQKQQKEKDPIECCFTLLYGVLLLRLSGKNISKETGDAASKVGVFLSELASKYHAYKRGELKLHEE